MKSHFGRAIVSNGAVKVCVPCLLWFRATTAQMSTFGAELPFGAWSNPAENSHGFLVLPIATLAVIELLDLDVGCSDDHRPLISAAMNAANSKGERVDLTCLPSALRVAQGRLGGCRCCRRICLVLSGNRRCPQTAGAWISRAQIESHPPLLRLVGPGGTRPTQMSAVGSCGTVLLAFV